MNIKTRAHKTKLEAYEQAKTSKTGGDDAQLLE